jgi:predicted SAM-dependent methyltransferase
MLKRIMRRFLPDPVCVLLSKLKAETRVNFLHSRGVSKARALDFHTDLKLNLGCGRKPKPGWINIDLNAEADFTLDLRKSLPFPDNSCSIIYSEHLLEHLEYPREAELLVAESFRVLKPGGAFSVGVPDTELAIAAYLEGLASSYFGLIAKHGFHPEWCSTRMEHLNCHFRYSEHKFAYDLETLKKLLKQSGFTHIAPRDFDPDLDSEDREGLTLYLGARKDVR